MEHSESVVLHMPSLVSWEDKEPTACTPRATAWPPLPQRDWPDDLGSGKGAGSRDSCPGAQMV